MQPNPQSITLRDNRRLITEMLTELVLRPRCDFIRWASITKQTPNMKIGYPGQHLASLITGVEGERTGARGHDLRDGSEVKACSRVDQLDKCNDCKAAVARIEDACPECNSTNVERNNDSKWLFAIRSQHELDFLLDDVPRVVLILSDYPNYDDHDWSTIQFQAFEIWPGFDRHLHFRALMEGYYQNIYLAHIKRNPTRTPAPKNFWPYSFQFYMCNPVRIFHCIVTNANVDPQIDIREYVEPDTDRATIDPLPMPLYVLNSTERAILRRELGKEEYEAAEKCGLTEAQRACLTLRDTGRAVPHTRLYRRGARV